MSNLKKLTIAVDLTPSELYAIYERLDSGIGDNVLVEDARELPALPDDVYHDAMRSGRDAIGRAIDELTAVKD